MKKLFLLLLISASVICRAQFSETHYKIIQKNTWYKWDFDFEFSSVSFGITKGKTFEKAQLVNGEQIFLIKKDEHADNDSLDFANLMILNKSERSFRFFSAGLEGVIYVYLHYAPPINKVIYPEKKFNNCVLPPAIGQSVWRAGLPDPKGIRTTSEVRHLAVHHSAGSNTDTNYINVIRNIYLYHVNQNGWDDIAYNYLIAQDGTLFLGRDSMGVGEHDNIVGAHFCAKNTGTMGVCLLGNYEEVSLPEKVYTTLKQVLTWKCAKENLLPDDEEIHPKNGTEYLKHVVGHRDGCATECPGDSVYQLLSEMRKEIRTELYNCAPTTSTEFISFTGLEVFPNPADNELYINNYEGDTIELSDLLGRKFIVTRSANDFFVLNEIPNGIYFLNLFPAYSKIIIQH